MLRSSVDAFVKALEDGKAGPVGSALAESGKRDPNFLRYLTSRDRRMKVVKTSRQPVQVDGDVASQNFRVTFDYTGNFGKPISNDVAFRVVSRRTGTTWGASKIEVLLDEAEGFVKLLAHPETGEILGGGCIGPQGGELIHEIIVRPLVRRPKANPVRKHLF